MLFMEKQMEGLIAGTELRNTWSVITGVSRSFPSTSREMES